MTDEIASPVVKTVRKDGDILHYRVITPYDPDIVIALRAIPKAKWHPDLRAWVIPSKSRDHLIDALPDIEAKAKEVTVERAREREEREEKRAAEKAGRQAEAKARDADRARIRAQRTMVLVFGRPEIGVPVRLNGQIVVIESYGRSWVQRSEAHESYSYGMDPGLLDLMIGREVCYAYWRPATSEEACIAPVQEHTLKERVTLHNLSALAIRGREMPLDF